MIDWKKGPPRYDEDKGDCHVWLVLHDQSGREWVTVGWLYGKHGPEFEAEFASWVAWMRSGREGARPHRPLLIAHLRVPSLSADSVLSHWVNIVAHAEIETPALPERT